MEIYHSKQAEDPVCSKVMEYCRTGWPRKYLILPNLIPYWKLRSSFTIYNDVLLFNERTIIPPTLQKETLQKIYEGHQGIERCRVRARTSVLWPNVSKQIADMVQNCPECTWLSRWRKESLLGIPLPEFPWKVMVRICLSWKINTIPIDYGNSTE